VRLATSSLELLWQRPTDAPRVRVGSSAQPSSLTIEAPSQADDDCPDPLVDAARALARSATWLTEAPVCMAVDGGCALRGTRPLVLAAARSLLMQLATHYPLPLAVVFAAAEHDAWRWARWLPQVQTANGSRRLAWDAAAVPRVLAAGGVAVLAAPALAPRLPQGVTPIYLLDEGVALPSGCARLVEVDHALSGTLHAPGLAPTRIERVDGASVELAERLARTLFGKAERPARADGEGIVEVHLDGSRTTLPATGD